MSTTREASQAERARTTAVLSLPEPVAEEQGDRNVEEVTLPWTILVGGLPVVALVRGGTLIC